MFEDHLFSDNALLIVPSARKVTVLGLCVCVCVSTTILTLQATRRLIA